jgi:hypothetical protein
LEGREIRYIEIELVLFANTREDGLVLNSNIYYRLTILQFGNDLNTIQAAVMLVESLIGRYVNK